MPVAIALAVMLLPSPPGVAQSSDQRRVAKPVAGLMWNRSGLPAVFPLQVKTLPGYDYMLTLSEESTGKAVLAAFIEGGKFFRVLTPPGTYDIDFAYGETWQGEEGLFGPGEATKFVSLNEPLTFKALGLGRKQGFIVDLTKGGLEKPDEIVVADAAICQRFRLIRVPRPLPPFGEDPSFATRLTGEGELVQHPEAGFDPERLTGAERPIIPTDHAPYFSEPAFEIVQDPC